MKKIMWDFIEGNVKVKAKGIDENDDIQYFEFQCYIGKEINSYDRMDLTSDVAHVMGKLRSLYHIEIVDVEELANG